MTEPRTDQPPENNTSGPEPKARTNGATEPFIPEAPADNGPDNALDEAPLELDESGAEPASEVPQIGDVPPKTFQSDLSDLPTALTSMKKERRWVLWRWKFQGIDKDGAEKWTKVPHKPSGGAAKNNDPTTWSTYQACVAALATGKFAGLGFCLLGSDFRAFDVDKCRDPVTGELKEYALELLDRCGDTYAEVTVSGTGIRIIGTGSNKDNCQKKYPVEDGVSVELYRCTKTARYITVSGSILPGNRETLIDLDDVIDEVLEGCEAQRSNAENGKAKKQRSSPRQPTEEGELTGKMIEMLSSPNLGAGVQHGEYAGRSELMFGFVCRCLRGRIPDETIVQACLDAAYTGRAIHQHCLDNGGAQYIERQIAHARDKIAASWEFDKNGNIATNSQHNIRVALTKMGVALSYNTFTDQYLIAMSGVKDIINDAVCDDLWAAIDRKFKVLFVHELYKRIIATVARENSFHPIKDYLCSLKWDGNKRVGNWLVQYCGAENTEFNRKVGEIVLVAAVRRIMSPGCKFDELLILEGAQGDDKSTLLTTMAIRQEWFTDDVPIAADAQKFIEQLRGKWITELSELSGMGKRDIEHVKSTLSRQRDRARMAFGRFVEEVARSFIIVGTTNSTKYLMDLTGNRRFWPVLIGKIKIDEFKGIIDQLWAEAAQLEKAGASIRLPRALWKVAAAIQGQRTVEEPWFEILSTLFGDRKGKVRSRDLWAVLDMEDKIDRQNQAFSKKLSEIMQRLGFKHANLSFGGIKDWGYARGAWDEMQKRIIIKRAGTEFSAAYEGPVHAQYTSGTYS